MGNGRPWEAAPAPLSPGGTCPVPGVSGLGAGCEGGWVVESLAESLAAALRYPERCLLLVPRFGSASFCFQMKPTELLLGRTLLRVYAADVLISAAPLCSNSVY